MPSLKKYFSKGLIAVIAAVGGACLEATTDIIKKKNQVDVKHPGFAKVLSDNAVWETRTFSLRGSEPQHLITVYHRAPDEANHRTLAEYMVIFLHSLESPS